MKLAGRVSAGLAVPVADVRRSNRPVWACSTSRPALWGRRFLQPNRLLEIAFSKIQREHIIALGNNDLWIGQVSSQIFRKQIDFREHGLLFPAVDKFAEGLARGFGGARDAELGDEARLDDGGGSVSDA